MFSARSYLILEICLSSLWINKTSLSAEMGCTALTPEPTILRAFLSEGVSTAPLAKIRQRPPSVPINI
uniref:Uncharacterized protein n=1 Tax=uncultured marine virus TaxID=186617 RepID=A0A0F7L7U9_9VIRU|nr:hypothetical protein [uncultured marine virus]